ncbi:hypothetical protein HC251_18780 [Iamia sp. SCSIO 61187]|uniref:hypothetical protein n=1 Tax=Iamia sp. SCSIO 61187 TaxID=2722752 RepID=UPI001C62E1F4|nr:hypothetical protein [Iamia sp. SCSIO 61187]QYG94277.1 hypothetical protein HC251_18780 [Iamia sp. SCSIO 61187]
MNAMTALVGRRAVLDYARRPLKLVLLIAVPVVLVFVWGGTLADFSKLVGGTADQVQVEAATAGWAAAVLAGLGGFFQVSGSRAADRRLAAAGHRTAPVAAGRLGASLGLAAVAAAGACWRWPPVPASTIPSGPSPRRCWWRSSTSRSGCSSEPSCGPT